ncbi:hypothetical protein ACMA1D_14085 [Streptomyces sp. 796.1]|uniref:hypothetical protein n=1 Tax=Streptomyces sp. 796.1 TaxID=3163029 RepID=UPI0039C99562
MALLTTLARMEAVRCGRALPAATVLHRHLADRPLVFVPLTTAGEAGAPLGALVGTDRDAPRLLVVPQPRDRDLRFTFLAELAEAMLPHFAGAADEVEWEERKETDPETGKRVTVQVELCADAPQLLVPSGPGIDFVRLLGRSMRFRRAAEHEPEGVAGSSSAALRRPPVGLVAGTVREDGGTEAQRAGAGDAAGTPATGDPARAGADDPAQASDAAVAGTAAQVAAPARVPLLGRWLTHYGERARVPGSSLLLALTDLLGQHWATGQSRIEDQHLGALLAWIDPPEGLTGPEAALLAESARDARGQLRRPPAGPATDPAFDNRLLAPTMARYDAARAGGDPAAIAEAEQAMRALVAGQLQPTWDALWHGIDLLRTLPVGARVGERWKRDRWSYTGHRDRVRAGEPPQPKWDDAVTAARKLAARETAQTQLDAQEALDDPLVMAARRLAGEAFAGAVTAVEMAYSQAKVPRPRPLVTLTTDDRPLLDEGTKLYRALAGGKTQTAEFVAYGVAERDGAAGPAEALTLVVRLTGGMGRGKVPEAGTVPETGDRVCWTLFEHAPRGGPELPEPEQTPWTHGGPPLHAGAPTAAVAVEAAAVAVAGDAGAGGPGETGGTSGIGGISGADGVDNSAPSGAAAETTAEVGNPSVPSLPPAFLPDPVTDEDFL